MSSTLYFGIGIFFVVTFIGICAYVMPKNPVSNKHKAIAVTIGIIQAIYILLYCTGALAMICEANVYLGFAIYILLALTCLMLSIWLMTPSQKFSSAIKYLFVFLAVIQMLATMNIFLLPEAGMPALIQSSVREVKQLPTTDLSHITIDDIQIGSHVNDIDLSLYQESDRFSGSGNYAYCFDRLVLDVDGENKVNYLFGYNSEVLISVNGHTLFSATTRDIIALLGNDYLDKQHDREQRLRKYIYYDNEAGIEADFIYHTYDRQVVWITLKKLA